MKLQKKSGNVVSLVKKSILVVFFHIDIWDKANSKTLEYVCLHDRATY